MSSLVGYVFVGRLEAKIVEAAAVWGGLPFIDPAKEQLHATRGHTVPLWARMGVVLAHPATEDNDGNNREGEDEGSSHRQHFVLSLMGL